MIPFFHFRHDFKSSDANDVENVSKQLSSTKIDFQEQKEKSKETRLKKAKTAEFLWKQSKPITQSQLGKKYLTEHRKIPGYILAYLEFKLLRKGTKENNIFQSFILILCVNLDAEKSITVVSKLNKWFRIID